MQKINLVGQLFNSSGYANHTKGLFNALADIAKVKLDIPLPAGFEANANDKELEAIKREWMIDGVTVCISLPQYWEIYKSMQSKKFFGFLVWEGDKIPRSFIYNIENCDGVFVPSEHTKQAVEAVYSGNVPIHVIPHGVDSDFFAPLARESDQPFTFFCNKGFAQGINDRGGLYYAIKAFQEEFKQDEPVQMKIKINTAYKPDINVHDELNAMGLKPQNNLLVSTDNIDYNMLNKLYDADVFVSPTRAEAFSLPCIEALSCGVPVIITNFGGQTDFVNDENGWIIGGDLVEVDHDTMYEGIKWLVPSISELRVAMRDSFVNEEERIKKSKTAREDGLLLNWKHSAELLIKAI